MQRHRQRPYLHEERWLKAREQYSQREMGILKTRNGDDLNRNGNLKESKTLETNHTWLQNFEPGRSQRT